MEVGDAVALRVPGSVSLQRVLVTCLLDMWLSELLRWGHIVGTKHHCYLETISLFLRG